MQESCTRKNLQKIERHAQHLTDMDCAGN